MNKTYRSLTSAQVLEKLRLAPLSLELRIRRLRYYEQLAMWPANHRQIFAVQKLNPWLDQFIEDMEDFLQLDSAAELLYGFLPRRPLTPFKEFSAAFCQVDPPEFYLTHRLFLLWLTLLRVRVLSNSPLCLRRRGRPLPRFVLIALELFQRYQALDITSKLHWIVVTVDGWYGQSAILSDVFYSVPVFVSTS